MCVNTEWWNRMRSISEDSDEDSRRRTVQGIGSSTERHDAEPTEKNAELSKPVMWGQSGYLPPSPAAPLLLFSDLSKCNGWSPSDSPHVEGPIF